MITNFGFCLRCLVYLISLSSVVLQYCGPKYGTELELSEMHGGDVRRSKVRYMNCVGMGMGSKYRA